MAHGHKKPRVPRTVRNPIEHAISGAAKLTPAQIKSTLAPAWECEALLRRGVATQDQHTVVYTSLSIAKCIEATGVVRGLREHIDTALLAMETASDRALASGTWRAPMLDHDEMNAIREALHLHEFQLQQVSTAEIDAITRKLIARTHSTGGMVRRCAPQSLGLVAGATP